MRKIKVTERIRNLFKTKNTADLTEWYKLADFLGIDKNMDKDARAEATYYACLKILRESIGKLPLKLMQKTKKDGVIEARKHPYYNVLRNRPNKYMTATHFKSTIEQYRNHYGNAYVYIAGAGKKLQLIPLDPTQVQVWYDDGKLLSDIPDVFYLYTKGKDTYKFGSEEILHFKSSDSTDGIKGLAVREQLQSTITGNQKAQKLQNTLYESGFTAKAVVQYTGDLNDASRKHFMANIEKYAKGEVDTSKGLIPIPVGTQLIPLNTKLGDNEFLELKKYSALQIAAAFGIKPVQINDYSKSSYASSEAQNLAFLVDTLLYIINQYEEELNYKLLSDEEIKKGYFFKFNISMLLRADMKTQLESFRGAVESGIYTRNEARELLDMPAKDGGDELTVNGSTVNLKDVGIQYQQKSSNGSEETPEEDQEDVPEEPLDKETLEGGENE